MYMFKGVLSAQIVLPRSPSGDAYIDDQFESQSQSETLHETRFRGAYSNHIQNDSRLLVSSLTV